VDQDDRRSLSSHRRHRSLLTIDGLTDVATVPRRAYVAKGKRSSVGADATGC
jgi:hypothetical protein